MKRFIEKGMALSLSVFMMMALLPGAAMAEEYYEGEGYEGEGYYEETYPEEYTQEEPVQEMPAEGTEMPAEGAEMPAEQLPVVAEVNGTGYTDLTSAFLNAGDQSTVVLRENITLANGVSFSHPFETVTLNFDGHTITMADPSEYVERDASGGEMTGQGGFLSVKAGTLKLVDNGNGEGGISSTNWTKAAIEVAKDESAGTHLEISGGRYKNADGQSLIKTKDAYGSDNPDAAIAHGSDPMLSVSVSGGTFGSSLPDGYMSDGYATVQQEDGSYKADIAPAQESQGPEENGAPEDNAQAPEGGPEQGNENLYPGEEYPAGEYPAGEYPADGYPAEVYPPQNNGEMNPGAEEIPVTPVSYTVYFDLRGLGAPDYPVVQNVTEGGLVIRPEADPSAEGCRFTGWYADPECTSPFDFNTPVYTDLAIFAGWVRQLDVSFYSEHGYQPESLRVDAGSVLTRPEPDPSEEGWIFGGWYTDAECTAEYSFGTPVTDNLVLYAKWTEDAPVMHTVTFVEELDGTQEEIGTETVPDGEPVQEPEEVPEEAGYHVENWYADENMLEVYNFSAPVTEDMLLTAAVVENTYTVHFDGNGGTLAEGSEMPDLTCTYGVSQNLPANQFIREGYTFAGWNTAADGTGTAYADKQEISNLTEENGGLVTLYAQWTESKPVTYTVSFDLKGHGTAVDPQTVESGKTAAAPDPAPSEEGWTFENWYSDESLETPYDFSAPVTGDITLYAKWSQVKPETYTVSFDLNGHGTAVDPQTVEAGKTAAAPEPAPSEEGWTFEGWYSDEGLQTPYDFAAPVTGDITLYAKWSQVKPETYTVSFDLKGHGTAVDPQTVEAGKTAAVPDPAPSEAGWTFDGWYSDENLETPYEFSEPVTKDITLYAKWTENGPVSFTVTFNMNGHGSAIKPQTVNSGEKAATPADPSENGWVFGGWFTDQACTVPYNFSAEVTADLELFAKWTKTFTVSFNMKGHGQQIRTQTVAEGSAAVRPADPRENGWIFAGWFTNDACTEGYNFVTPVRGNLTLYARWIQRQPNRYAVYFNANGHGVMPDPQTITDGQTAARPADPSAPGYTFTGWFRDAKCTSAYNFSTPVREDLTLYAGWVPNSYVIQFNANGGTGTMSGLTCVYDQTATLPAVAFTRSGYTFTGWNTAADGSGVAYGNSAQVKNLTNVKGASVVLYAQWRADYAVIEGANGKVQKSVPNGGGITFRINGDYNRFVGIAVDGNNVTAGQYTAWAQDGTTYVRLNQAYVDQLAAGRHAIVFMFRDGSTSTYFEVTASGALTPVSVTPTPTGVPVPRTGDTSRMLLWSLLAAAAAAGLTVLLAIRRKHS